MEKRKKVFSYGFKYQYRVSEGSEPVTDYGFVDSTDTDKVNACEIAMLKHISKHGYFSGKILEIKVY